MRRALRDAYILLKVFIYVWVWMPVRDFFRRVRQYHQNLPIQTRAHICFYLLMFQAKVRIRVVWWGLVGWVLGIKSD